GATGGGSGVLEDGGRQVRRQHMPGGPNAARRGQRLTSRAGRHVEYAPAGSNAGTVEHYFSGRAEPVLQRRTPAVPCFSRLLPLLPSGRFEVGRIKRSFSHGYLLESPSA